MDNDNGLLPCDSEGVVAFRHYTYYRPTILILLNEHESYGYELAGRMTELGFGQRLAAGLYRVLRDMENEGLIASSWESIGHGGPRRRVYSLTTAGGRYLHDSVPLLVRQREGLGAMLELYSRVEQEKPSPVPVSGTVSGRSRPSARGSSDKASAF